MDPFSVMRMFWLIIGAMMMALFSMFGRTAHGYIPKARVILEKAAKQHGRGLYFIQQELSFRDESGPTLIQEDWIIENGESMYLDSRGTNHRAVILFKEKQKIIVDEKGNDRSEVIGDDFFEPIFHFRSWDSLASALVKEKIIPTKNLSREGPLKKDLKEPAYSPDSFVRLSRFGGVITFALGRPTPADSAKPLPGIWIDQDRYLIRKIRLESLAEVVAEDYSEYSAGLWFPKTRTVSWDDKSVQIRVLKVSSMSASEANKQKLSPSYFRSRKSDQLQRRLGEGTIREFYERFR